MSIRSQLAPFALPAGVLTMMAVGLITVAPAKAATWKCTESSHCYALAEWHMAGCSTECIDGGVADITSQSANVPGWEKGAFVTNEMWASTNGEGWVETGQVAGNGMDCCSEHRFFAAESTNNLNYYEYDQPDSVPINQYHSYVIQDLSHNGAWGIYWGYENTEWTLAHEYGGFWPHIDELEAGMEGATNSQPTNEGDQELAGVWGSPEGWHPWGGVYKGVTFSASPATCIAQMSGSWPGNATYHTPC
ncbi:MAG TPA: hypothetical protein VK781_09170 [Solirubrobacteraceae bacterium]|jgi:hypothetical protein|nr:hypothetical protein [Solirubrobacteraceae bacterium]